MNARLSRLVAIAVLVVATATLSCYEPAQDFQPATAGAKPWDSAGGLGSRAAVRERLLRRHRQLPGVQWHLLRPVHGDHVHPVRVRRSVLAGRRVPKSLVCCANDFPPVNWLELIKYSGPGWAGLSSGADTRTCP